MAIKHRKVFTVCYINEYLLSALQLFKKKGFIYDYMVVPQSYFKLMSLCGLNPAFSSKVCVIYLRYSQEHGISLHNIKLLSKPSRQLYVTWKSLKKLAKPDSIAEIYILNTVNGVMSHDAAIQAQIGGNLIALIT